MALRLTVLGCAGSYPAPGGACSGYLVEDGRTRIWLDAGSGTLANLQRHVGLGEVDAVVLSHRHPDHWADLEGYHVALSMFLDRQTFPVYAPAELKALVTQDTRAWADWHDVADGDKVDIGALALTFSRTDHGPVTLGVRIAGGGASLASTADTGPAWSVQALGDGLDAVLSEASLPAAREGEMQHLSARQAGTFARDARAKRLILTHIWPTLDPEESRMQGSEAFGAEAELAAIGRSFEL